jgi:hypothetical protein
MNASPQNPGMKLQHKLASHDRRGGAEQALMYGHVTYTYKEGVYIYTIEGLIRDLSETGCGIRGPMPQVVGSQIKVMLSLPDQQPPLCVSGALVSWVAGDFFGVKFPKLKPHQYDRVQQLVRKMAG